MPKRALWHKHDDLHDRLIDTISVVAASAPPNMDARVHVTAGLLLGLVLARRPQAAAEAERLIVSRSGHGGTPTILERMVTYIADNDPAPLNAMRDLFTVEEEEKPSADYVH